jgi:hypothetical protein
MGQLSFELMLRGIPTEAKQEDRVFPHISTV